jgi:hypothetical protein
MCLGEEMGIFAAKYKDCLKCPFYLLVMEEEGRDFMPAKELLNRLRKG